MVGRVVGREVLVVDVLQGEGKETEREGEWRGSEAGVDGSKDNFVPPLVQVGVGLGHA